MDRHLKYWLLMGLYSSVLLAMPITVLANTNTQNSTDLPQIVSWDDGHGYLESGEMLRNGWGYDTVQLENMCSLMKRVLSLDARNPWKQGWRIIIQVPNRFRQSLHFGHRFLTDLLVR